MGSTRVTVKDKRKNPYDLTLPFNLLLLSHTLISKQVVNVVLGDTDTYYLLFLSP